ncbi:MAG: hypothetical protein GF334_10200 [Candidatus Altiarchaeales archaeon]|nr:hypothetical protein [Candidatus Altiarchaeales archaeon]
MTDTNKLYTGDVNSLEHGGGVVVDQGYGPIWFFWDSEEEREQYPEGLVTEDKPYRVWSCAVEDNILDWFDWVTAEELTDNTGRTVEEIKEDSTGGLMARVSLMETICSMHGADNLDSYPTNYSQEDMEDLLGIPQGFKIQILRETQWVDAPDTGTQPFYTEEQVECIRQIRFPEEFKEEQEGGSVTTRVVPNG